MVVPHLPKREPKDFYKILGVSVKATTEEIRSAYRKRARECHPDKNKEDGAELRFKELVSAHEILSNKEKRKEHDLLRGVWERRERRLDPSKDSFRTSFNVKDHNTEVTQAAYDELHHARQCRADLLKKRREGRSTSTASLTPEQREFWKTRTAELARKKKVDESRKKVTETTEKTVKAERKKQVQKASEARKKAASRAARVQSVSPLRPPTKPIFPTNGSGWRSFSNLSLPPTYVKCL